MEEFPYFIKALRNSDLGSASYRSYWNSTDGVPVTVTYSFMHKVPSYITPGKIVYGGDVHATFQRFTASQRETARVALQAWQAVSGLVFAEVPEDAAGVGTIRFGRHEMYVGGYAYYPFVVDGVPRDGPSGDIFIDSDQLNPLRTLLHEIGHAIGFKHPFDGDDTLPSNEDNKSNTVLSYTGTPEFTLNPRLGVFDIAAVQEVYGVNPSVRATGNTYRFGEAGYLWDGAGIDTITAAKFGESVRITLVPGSWSHAGASPAASILSPGQVFIGYGTMIEHAVGSRFNDHILGNATDNRLQGDAGDDILDGGAGNDSLIGGPGSNTASYQSAAGGVRVSLLLARRQNTGSAGRDTLVDIANLTGSSFADTLVGNDEANVLDGGSGDDTLSGGGGNDKVVGGAGMDTASYLSATRAVSVSLAVAGLQDTLGAGVDALDGVEGLVGSAFADWLTGNSGDNTLEGGIGDDRLVGGGGNDTASYSSAVASVTVSLLLNRWQNTAGAGRDTLSSIESLTGSAFADILTGNDADNVLDGGTGDDHLVAGLGRDTASFRSAVGGVKVSLALATAQNTLGAGTDVLQDFENLTGSMHDDRLTGNRKRNVLDGGAGNDRLDGAGGGDHLRGGAGNDLYLLRDPGDRPDETFSMSPASTTDAGGTDEIRTPYSIDLDSRIGLRFIENATMSGADDGDLLGNELDNRLAGNGGDNVLNGRAGSDTLAGGAGDDTYYVDQDDYWDDAVSELAPGDRVDETTEGMGGARVDAGGRDRVISSVSISLNADDGVRYVENLTLTGNADIHGWGNFLDNRITGNRGDNMLFGAIGNDILDGGAGDDKLTAGGFGSSSLTGGSGSDTFVFNWEPSTPFVHTITDFNAADDTIELYNLAFPSFAEVGQINPGAFVTGTKARQADDRIIFNRGTGALLYDADGAGSSDAVQFAMLSNVVGSLTAAHFVVA